MSRQDKDSMFPNCVNLNLYEHGDHQVAWHSDDEPLFRGKFQDILWEHKLRDGIMEPNRDQ